MAFLAGFAFVAAINFLLADVSEERRKRQILRAREELRLRSAERARAEWKKHESQHKILSRNIQQDSNPSLREKWRLFILQSGIASLGPETLLVLSLCISLLGGAFCFLYFQKAWLGLIVGAILGPIPFWYVLQKRKSRQRKLLKQLPDAYQMIARGLRSGQTVSQAMRAISDEVSSPLAEEFAYCWEQQNLGLTPEASLKELAKRTGILEIKIFVVALTINASSGGNLSQLLEKLSTVIRDREKMRDKVLALTAEGRMQAYMLIALPFGLAAMISAVNPSYLMPLLDYRLAIIGMLVWMGVGFLWMQSIIHFDQ